MTKLLTEIRPLGAQILSAACLTLVALVAHGQEMPEPSADEPPLRTSNPEMISARINAAQRAALMRASQLGGGQSSEVWNIKFDDQSLRRAHALGVSIETNVCSAVNSRDTAGGPNVVMGQSTRISCVVHGN